MRTIPVGMHVGSLGAHAQPVPRNVQSGFAVQSVWSLPYAAHTLPVSTGAEAGVLVERAARERAQD